MKVRKECVDGVLGFTSEKLKRDRVILIPSEVRVYHIVMHGVHRKVEVLDFSNPVSS